MTDTITSGSGHVGTKNVQVLLQTLHSPAMLGTNPEQSKIQHTCSQVGTFGCVVCAPPIISERAISCAPIAVKPAHSAGSCLALHCLACTGTHRTSSCQGRRSSHSQGSWWPSIQSAVQSHNHNRLTSADIHDCMVPRNCWQHSAVAGAVCSACKQWTVVACAGRTPKAGHQASALTGANRNEQAGNTRCCKT